MKGKKPKAIEYLPDITTKLIYEDKVIKYNTPVQIKNEGRLFKINTNDFLDKIEFTWKCEYYSHLKNKPKTQNWFCEATIKGIRMILEDKYKFYLKEDHSEICKDTLEEETKLEKRR